MMSKEKDEQIERLKTDLGRAQLNTQQLKIRCDQLEESNERLRKECEDAKKSAESERRNSTVVADENKQLERSNQMLTEQIAEMQSTMESAREKNDKLEDELADRNALITRLETENRSNIIDIKKLTDQLQILKGLEIGVVLQVINRSLSIEQSLRSTKMFIEIKSVTGEINQKLQLITISIAKKIGCVKNQKALQTATNEGEVLRERIEALQSETVQLSEMIEELNRAKEAAEAVAQQHAVAENVSNSDDHAAHESGGSGGWSDVGDFDIETPAINDEKKNVSPPLTAKNVQQQQTASKGNDNSTLPSQTKSGSTGDIMEVARLRAQLKRLEIDLDQTRLSLQKEENVREHLTRKLELAELEANERKKETEAKESERVDTHNQCKKMLAMVEERDAKIRHSEQLTEKLRDEIDKWQTEVRHLQEQNKVIENKLNDAEQELKRLRAENNRLETRHFHEMRECKHTITTLRQVSRQLIHYYLLLLWSLWKISLEEAQRMAATATAAIPPQLPDSGGNNLMNLSSNGSSDREYPSAHAIGSRLGPPPLPAIRPLWGDDEAAEVFSAGESISSMMSGRGLRHTATSPDNLSSGVPLKKGSVRSRRSQREQPRREVSPEIDLMQHAPRPKKLEWFQEGRRMRSRSHGRHPFLTNAPSYMMMQPPAFPDLFSDHPPPPTLPFQPSLHKRNSKSGNLYYSSGGSNGGLSPPPEMALLSGVPPPGMSIRKPTATSRPKSWFSFLFLLTVLTIVSLTHLNWSKI
ncbi:unnamed protein product [Anisakis simplex]|uniref:GRIP domain-containing protein n=1 Tax=Anisakis simplex TaxID=6269 RepID=A0A0M3JY99_ANISI|nr:unnamed protein product [Anisakis simplex]